MKNLKTYVAIVIVLIIAGLAWFSILQYNAKVEANKKTNKVEMDYNKILDSVIKIKNNDSIKILKLFLDSVLKTDKNFIKVIINDTDKIIINDTNWYYFGKDTIYIDTIIVEMDSYFDKFLTYKKIKILNNNLINYQYKDSLIVSLNRFKDLKCFPNFLKQFRNKLCLKSWKYKLNSKLLNDKASIPSEIILKIEK